MAFFESEKTGDTPEEESGGGRASLLPRQIWIKSTYCRIKVSAINISSQENLPVVAHTPPPPQPFLFCPFLSFPRLQFCLPIEQLQFTDVGV